jgi:hypothetical protein
MTNTPRFYEIAPRTAGLERLDTSDGWSELRDLVQHDLSALDHDISGTAGVRAGSNQRGDADLFVYRVYEPAPGSGIDPVVVGIIVRPTSETSPDHFTVSGDIAGEMKGDILFDVRPRNVIGRMARNEAARDISSELCRQGAIVSAALQDAARKE